MDNSGTRLYVKSAKTVTGTVKVNYRIWAAARDPSGYGVEREPSYDYMLAEDDQKIVEMVERVARAHSLEVEVLDVTRENVVHRILQEEMEKIKTFPTLIAGSQERIEGEITEEQVESLFSRIAERSRKKYL